jgi:hypothetical protein
MSKSLNKFIFQTKSEGQWVGEELLFPVQDFTGLENSDSFDNPRGSMGSLNQSFSKGRRSRSNIHYVQA